MAQPNLCLVTTSKDVAVAGFLSFIDAEAWAKDKSRSYGILTVYCDLTYRKAVFENGQRASYDRGAMPAEAA
jgi:D-serine dehydratase